jgi:hypothetical protein
MAEKKIVDLVVKDNIQETEGHLKNLSGQIKTSQKDVKSLQQSFEYLEGTVYNLDDSFEEVYGDLKPLTARMGEAEDRLYELALAGKQGTEEFKALLASVGNYRKTQIQTDLAVDAAATTLTQKLGGSLEFVSGAFASTQGAIALFGEENKDVEKAILKVQSALAITQGFAAMREGANSVRQLGTAIKSLTIFQTAYNFVNNATSTGLKVLRGALIATGIGALVIGVGLLIANFDKLKAMALKLVPGLATVGNAIGGIVNAVTDFVGITSEAGRATERMLENADKAIKKNDKFLAENASKLDDYTKRKIDANKEYNEALKKDGADQVALAKEYNRKLDKINAERVAADAAKAKEAKDKQDQKNKEEKDKLDAYNKSIKDKIKGFNDDVLDINAKTEQQKLDLWKARQIVEINLLAKNQKDKNALLLALDKDYYAKQKLLRDANNAEDEKVFRGFERGKAKIKVDTTKESEAKTISILKSGMDKSLENAKNYTESQLSLARAEADGKRALLAITAQALGQFSELLGRQTAEGKALAVAQATINAYLAISEVWKAPNPYPEPFGTATKVASTVVVGAAAFKSISDILAVQVPGGGGGGGAAAAPPATPRFNVVGASPASANQIANTVGRDLPPVKAYVVSNDVTTAQSLDRNIISSASLG